MVILKLKFLYTNQRKNDTRHCSPRHSAFRTLQFISNQRLSAGLAMVIECQFSWLFETFPLKNIIFCQLTFRIWGYFSSIFLHYWTPQDNFHKYLQSSEIPPHPQKKTKQTNNNYTVCYSWRILGESSEDHFLFAVLEKFLKIKALKCPKMHLYCPPLLE